MNTLFCVPAYLFPLSRLKFSRFSIVPGVKIVRLTGGLKQTISSMYDQLPVKPNFGITHAVCIEEEPYLEKLKNRLIVEGGTKLPENTFIESESIAKQAILSLIIAGRISFAFQGVHQVKVEKKGRKNLYTAKGYSHGSSYQLSYPVQAALLQDTGNWPPLDLRKVARIAKKLDRYFRSGVWWTDRLSMALGYIWDGLCTPFSQQAFIGFTNALESLLSTQSLEITHILAERVAILTEMTQLNRLKMYDKVKDLYKVRSKIVHGKVFMKKGTLNSESLFISAKRSNVPTSKLKNLVVITLAVIIAVMSKPEFLSIIQTKRNEEKIKEDLNDYFTRALFRK